MCCQPLDTIKVRMQLSKSGAVPGVSLSHALTFYGCKLLTGDTVKIKPRGFIATGISIVRRETPLALYKGLGAVLAGIVPKMAIRFASFETYKSWLANKETGETSVAAIFFGTIFLFDIRPW